MIERDTTAGTELQLRAAKTVARDVMSFLKAQANRTGDPSWTEFVDSADGVEVVLDVNGAGFVVVAEVAAAWASEFCHMHSVHVQRIDDDHEQLFDLVQYGDRSVLVEWDG